MGHRCGHALKIWRFPQKASRRFAGISRNEKPGKGPYGIRTCPSALADADSPSHIVGLGSSKDELAPALRPGGYRASSAPPPTRGPVLKPNVTQGARIPRPSAPPREAAIVQARSGAEVETLFWARKARVILHITTRRPLGGPTGVSPSHARPDGTRGGRRRARPMRALSAPLVPGEPSVQASLRVGGSVTEPYRSPLEWPQSLCSSQIQPRGAGFPFGLRYDTRCETHSAAAAPGGAAMPHPVRGGPVAQIPEDASEIRAQSRSGAQIRSYPVGLAHIGRRSQRVILAWTHG
jgi:hypothetical protein